MFRDPRPIDSPDSRKSPPESFALTNEAKALLRYTMQQLGGNALAEEALCRRKELKNRALWPRLHVCKGSKEAMDLLGGASVDGDLDAVPVNTTSDEEE